MDILIIEDDKYLREAYDEILTLEGYDVRCAASLTEARCLSTNYHVDLVISDANLGGVDTFDDLCDVLHDLKQQGAKIMMISGSPEIRTTCLSQGFTFLLKPFSPTELLRIIPRV
ncbi:MAG: hypothetical protein CUN56_01210 [Phototrophicales bacterium]|nr:MAG: hypothetical protein CUN56_01210 [Phototrophicales bacterium]RMG72390.1 MAG: response regulator [Chloroflexota bacterium]